jgi:hypothetical protein
MRNTKKLNPQVIVLVNALAAALGGSVAQPAVAYGTATTAKALPFDNSDEARAARAKRRDERLSVLSPVGMQNANFIMKPDIANLLAVAEKVGKGKASKAERAAIASVIERVRGSSLRFTAGAKTAAGVKPFAFVEKLEKLSKLA